MILTILSIYIYWLYYHVTFFILEIHIGKNWHSIGNISKDMVISWKYWLYIANISDKKSISKIFSFNWKCLLRKANNSAILSLHWKYWKCKTSNFSVILVFYCKYFQLMLFLQCWYIIGNIFNERPIFCKYWFYVIFASSVWKNPMLLVQSVK